MKKTVFALGILALVEMNVSAVWINEIHYDNTGSDTGEGVEIAGVAGSDLTGWNILLYNGSNGARYATINLGGSIDDEGAGYGALEFLYNGIQNGAPDGIALVDPGGTLVEFLSYEGAFTAVGDAADGVLSTDIGVNQNSAGVGESLQLIGDFSAGFAWTGPIANSFGSLNQNQRFPTVDQTTTGSGSSVPDGGATALMLLGGAGLISLLSRKNLP